MAAQMRNFLDQTGPSWVRNAASRSLSRPGSKRAGVTHPCT